jgi:hypothetical protein
VTPNLCMQVTPNRLLCDVCYLLCMLPFPVPLTLNIKFNFFNITQFATDSVGDLYTALYI